MAVIFKCFTTHKRGEKDEDIQDSICFNEDNCRFALSDGVSQSFLPRLLADILTESYVDAGGEDYFPNENLARTFANRKDAYISSLDEFGMAMQEIAEETFKKAAATFVGLEIRERFVSWKVIGDSCLFIIPDKGSIRCLCSEKVSVDLKGKICVTFGSNTAQIQSDGNICGTVISDSAKKESGWYILMSDVISEWFINGYNKGDNVINKLYNLADNTQFEDLIEEEFQGKRIRSDDCSVILIRVEDEDIDAPQEKNEPDSDYFNDLETEESTITKPSNNNYFACVCKVVLKLIKKLPLGKSKLHNDDNNELHNSN